MADPERVTPLRREPLPDAIDLPADMKDAGLTPNEMRAVKAASGMRLDVLFGDGDETDSDDKTQAMVYVMLRRAGHDPTWDEAGDVRPIAGAAEADPTRIASSQSLQDSAGTGA
jgi:hypothetical protein